MRRYLFIIQQKSQQQRYVYMHYALTHEWTLYDGVICEVKLWIIQRMKFMMLTFRSDDALHRNSIKTLSLWWNKTITGDEGGRVRERWQIWKLFYGKSTNISHKFLSYFPPFSSFLGVPLWLFFSATLMELFFALLPCMQTLFIPHCSYERREK